jgi:hypothetical protein
MNRPFFFSDQANWRIRQDHQKIGVSKKELDF